MREFESHVLANEFIFRFVLALVARLTDNGYYNFMLLELHGIDFQIKKQIR